MARVRKDNVIYANFGARSQEVEDPLSQQVASLGVPGRLQNFVFALTDHARIQRGREYVRKAKVLEVELRDAMIIGQVSGSQLEPFEVAIGLPYRSTDEVSEISKLLVQEPAGIQRAREGDLPEDVIDLLLCHEASDLRLRCSCPDPSYSCKHAVAVALVAAQRLMEAPTLAFELRGLNIVALEQAMVSQAKVRTEERADKAEFFWSGGGLPELPKPGQSSALEDSDLQLLHKALRLVSYSSVEELRGVADIEDMFDFLCDR
ncbi:hypothetical protein [Corynebacterium gerontici]|uniref:SWIM-type domain-containing protein n=1 Tax=Corynebacterium gerontici TaxID=2079234 RepID=A0A3G6J094_9CORY|nr:hypothetical protein [Corynebacterium gerontici]AZA11203.1 hypothetical protein CGERO_04430 [Corynebacterium gerontici]